MKMLRALYFHLWRASLILERSCTKYGHVSSVINVTVIKTILTDINPVVFYAYRPDIIVPLPNTG